MSLLELDGLTVRYGGVLALDSVSLEIEAGTLVGLIGPNGAGKTTLIDAVTGMARYVGGLRLHGQSVSGWPAFRRSRAGIVRTFQSAELFMELTVRENLQTYAEARGHRTRGMSDGEAVDFALASMDVEWTADRYPAELSHGSARLVSVARALAASPELLLLDEPAAGLDQHESVILGEKLRGLVESGIATVLLVDHDVDLIMKVSDHINVLNFGRLIAAGPPAAIRSDPAVAEAYLGTQTPGEQPAGVLT